MIYNKALTKPEIKEAMKVCSRCNITIFHNQMSIHRLVCMQRKVKAIGLLYPFLTVCVYEDQR